MICKSFRIFLMKAVVDAGFLMPQIKTVIMNSLVSDEIKPIFLCTIFFSKDLFKYFAFYKTYTK